MRQTIVKLKKEINICTIVAPQTGGLIKSGSSGKFLKGYCPWCQPEQRAKHKANFRFWVNVEAQICNCHKCKFEKPMDVFNFYARLYNVSNLDAIQELSR